jgi:hypothetical protein
LLIDDGRLSIEKAMWGIGSLFIGNRRWAMPAKAIDNRPSSILSIAL